ncbi:hypothetical protein Bbelb_276670 [Branchiostoma belcheri]|nr:hypothetical protein Bbelb_276670 [Branchiostoma belcheri]
MGSFVYIEYNTGYSVSAEVSVRPRVGSPDGRRWEGYPTCGRTGTEGDAEYTVLKPPTDANTPTAPCALTSRLSAPFMSALAITHHARLRHICQRPSERRKWAYGAMCAHVPIVSALHVGISNHAPCTSTSHVSALRKDESRPTAPCALTPVSLAPFVPVG